MKAFVKLQRQNNLILMSCYIYPLFRVIVAIINCKGRALSFTMTESGFEFSGGKIKQYKFYKFFKLGLQLNNLIFRNFYVSKYNI